MGAGYLVAGIDGMAVAFAAAAAMNIFAYWKSDKLVLSLYGARRLKDSESAFLHETVARLAKKAKMPTPDIYLIDEKQPNAFATGRNPQHAAVAVTVGLMKHLERRELVGVLAHEMAHIKNRDTLIMTVTAIIAGALSMLANVAFLFRGRSTAPKGAIATLSVIFLAPLAALLVHTAISRTREFEADRVGAEICNAPYALADALAKLERTAQSLANRTADKNPATAHMFIVNPLFGGRVAALFSTHPETARRIARLHRLAEKVHKDKTSIRHGYAAAGEK